jgi:hypothetical protein
MSENRRVPRQLVLKTGRILSGPNQGSTDCAILNLSQGGACILIPASTLIADSFELFVDHHGSSYRCRVAWRNDCKVGVTFETKPSDSSCA